MSVESPGAVTSPQAQERERDSPGCVEEREREGAVLSHRTCHCASYSSSFSTKLQHPFMIPCGRAQGFSRAVQPQLHSQADSRPSRLTSRGPKSIIVNHLRKSSKFAGMGCSSSVIPGVRLVLGSRKTGWGVGFGVKTSAQ